MVRETYLILRVGTTRDSGLESVDTFDWRSGGPGGGAASPGLEYNIEAHELDEQDYREARSDPATTAMAKPMPLRLIEPVASETSDEPTAAAAPIHDATWGVYVTGALNSSYVGHDVTVAVLDTGIDADHEAFDGVDIVQRDFTGEGDGDEDGHGTHVAGTIFGQTTGNVRYSVAPGVRRAIIGKVLGVRRSASTQELIEAIQWAVAQGADIINMSLGFDFPGLVKYWSDDKGLPVDLATSRALAQYRDNMRFFDKLVEMVSSQAPQFHSALIVGAAGNESKRHVRPDYAIEVAPPAAADGIISVAAVGSAGPPHDALTVAPFSNTRAIVAGPGIGIYSAKAGGGYVHLNGTSMASPHVAGVAALWAERQYHRRGRLDISSLVSQLRANARLDRLPNANYLDVGEGLVSAPMD